VRRPCSDSSHVTAPYKLSFYYYYYYQDFDHNCIWTTLWSLCYRRNAKPFVSYIPHSQHHQLVVQTDTVDTNLSAVHNNRISVRCGGKNVDSSSKSNPLRRRGKNYDASTWRRRHRRRKKKSTNFRQKSCDLLTAITHTEILCALYNTNKQFIKKTKLWKQNGRCLDDVTTAIESL